MARSNFKTASETKSTKAKADVWINLTYTNQQTGKRSSLGGIPLTASESGFHKALIEKLQTMDADEQATFISNVMKHVSISITVPDSGESDPDFGLDAL